MSLIDFIPKNTGYYPGPYSKNQYNVVIAYFFEEDAQTAIDAAIELQHYYGGSRDQNEFNNDIIYGTELMDYYIRPVSIYNCTNVLKEEDFIKRFANEFFHVDELLFISSDKQSKYKDYLITACKLFRLPVFNLDRKNGFYLKSEVSPDDKELLSVFTSELMEDSNLENVKRIELSSYDGPTYYGEITDPKTGETSTKEIKLDFIFPNVPLKLSRRFEEWLDIWDIYFDETGSDAMVHKQELNFLVGAFNYYLNGRFTILTPDDYEGTPFYSDEDHLSEPLNNEQIKRLKKEVLGNRKLKEYFGKIGDSFLVSLENNEIIKILKEGSLQIMSSEALAINHPLFSGKSIPDEDLKFIQQALEKGEVLNLDEYCLKRRNSYLFTKINPPKYKEEI